MVPDVQALGAQHATYGVKDADCATVSSALLWTLQRGLSKEWDFVVQSAWAPCLLRSVRRDDCSRLGRRRLVQPLLLDTLHHIGHARGRVDGNTIALKTDTEQLQLLRA